MAGEFVAGEDFPWAAPIREHLRRKAIDNLTALAELRRAAGDLDGALRFTERAIEFDPTERSYTGSSSTYSSRSADVTELAERFGFWSTALLTLTCGRKKRPAACSLRTLRKVWIARGAVQQGSSLYRPHDLRTAPRCRRRRVMADLSHEHRGEHGAPRWAGLHGARPSVSVPTHTGGSDRWSARRRARA